MRIVFKHYKDPIFVVVVVGSFGPPRMPKNGQFKGWKDNLFLGSFRTFPSATLEGFSHDLKSRCNGKTMVSVSRLFRCGWNQPGNRIDIVRIVVVVAVVILRKMRRHRAWTCRRSQRRVRIEGFEWTARFLLGFTTILALKLSGNVLVRIKIRIGFHMVQRIPWKRIL